MGSRMRNLALQGRPNIVISLRGGHSSFISSFSTMDRLEGTVSITPVSDARFDDLEISFAGFERTYIDRASPSPSGVAAGRASAKHKFLHLTQPIDEASLPQPRVVEAGRTYRFPFTFVIPSQLLPRACSHRNVASDEVKEAHLQVPPSLGDPEVSGHGGSPLDDLAPEMTRIEYAIQVKMTRTREHDDSEMVIAEKSKKVRVRPAFYEQPPVDVDGKDSDYRLRQEKTIKKGFLKGRLGRLVMETTQPRSLHLPYVSEGEPLRPVTTVAKVLLRFDPAEGDTLPPQLNSLSSKLKVTTFFASTPRSNLPSKRGQILDANLGSYSESLPLSTRCMASVHWRRHDVDYSTLLPHLARRDSGISDCSLDNPVITGVPKASSAYAGRTFYTAELLVPVTLPTNKLFVPTFHTCLISRVYAIGLNLSVHGSSAIGGAHLSLRVPIQLSAEGSATGQANRSASEATHHAITEAEDVFRPRNVAPPRPEYLGGSAELMRGAPPGYEIHALAPGPGMPAAI